MSSQDDSKDEECCYWCKFWTNKDEKEDGDCRRHAPRPVTGKCLDEMQKDPEADWEFNLSTHWPNTHWEQWCGEFVPHSTRRLKYVDEQTGEKIDVAPSDEQTSETPSVEPEPSNPIELAVDAAMFNCPLVYGRYVISREDCREMVIAAIATWMNESSQDLGQLVQISFGERDWRP